MELLAQVGNSAGACVVRRDYVAIDNRAFQQLAKGFDQVRVLMIEGFVPPRKQVHAAIRFDGYGPLAVQLYFEEPIRAVRQVWDGGAVHWLDEIGFSFRKRFQPVCAASSDHDACRKSIFDSHLNPHRHAHARNRRHQAATV